MTTEFTKTSPETSVGQGEQEIIIPEVISNAVDLIERNIIAEELDRVKKENPPITVNGIDDRKNFVLCRESRLSVAAKRIEFTKFSKGVIDKMSEKLSDTREKANGIIASFKAIEKPLQDEEDRINLLKEDKMLQERIDQMAVYEVKLTIEDARKFKKVGDFKKALEKAKKAYDARLLKRAEELSQNLADKKKIDNAILEKATLPVKETSPIISVPDPGAPVDIPPPAEEPATDEAPVETDADKIATLRQQLVDFPFPECEGDKAMKLVYAARETFKKLIAHLDNNPV